VINVVDEHVQRFHALRQPGLQLLPFRRRDDAGDGIERNQPFGAGIVAIDGKGDADPAKCQVSLRLLAFDDFRGLALQPAAELAVVFTYFGTGGVRQPVSGHFIEEVSHIEHSLLSTLSF
jgi:hypothetical protein